MHYLELQKKLNSHLNVKMGRDLVILTQMQVYLHMH